MNEQPKRFAAFQEPLLAPSELLGMEIKLEDKYFPRYMSEKYNGIRGNCARWNDKNVGPCWLSRRQEPLAMAEHIKKMFEPLLQYSLDNDIVLDGEFYSRSLNKVGKTLSVLQGCAPVPDDFVFKCFYMIPYSVWNLGSYLPMGDMIAESLSGIPFYEPVVQRQVNSYAEFLKITEENKNKGLEGFMLLDPKAGYKHGKSTVNQGILLKFKYYTDPIDAQIFAIEEMKALRTDLVRTRNAVGRLKKIHTQDSYDSTDVGGCLWVKLKDGDTAKVPFPKGTSNAEKAEYLSLFKTGGVGDLFGKWIQFRRLSCEDGRGAIAVKGVEFRD